MPVIRGGVNLDDFRRLAGKTSDLEPRLKRELRSAFRIAAELAADESRLTIDAGGPSKTGLRLGIAAGIKVKLMTGKTAGVRIVSGYSQLPENKRAMPRTMNKPTFRHPVFGNTDVYVEQTGRPFFGSVIYKHRPAFEAAAREAMQKALDSLK